MCRLPDSDEFTMNCAGCLPTFLSYATHVNDPVSSITQCPSGQHTLAHTVCPGSGHWQLPFTQISASRQPQPQQPQFSVVFRGTHLPPQQSSPSAHSLPQAPQLFRSKTMLVHTSLQQRSSGEQHIPRHLTSPSRQRCACPGGQDGPADDGPRPPPG